MTLTLSLNTNPLVNRFAQSDVLIETIARDIKIRDVQLTHEFINPSWPASTIVKLTNEMYKALRRTGVRITSGMTGPYGRLNHFGHPNKEVRKYYVEWFKTFAEIIANLGGSSIGTQFAIFTFKDFDDPVRREDLIKIAIDCWAEVAEHGAKVGLEFIFWEPMSIRREFGETIQASLALQSRLSARSMAIPMWMMADIDHGDLTSMNQDDFDPYAWARSIPLVSPIIHIKQSSIDKTGHQPFVEKFNVKGRIQPEPFLKALNFGGARDNEICLELNFKEREPNDREVIPHIAESVAFWKPYVDTGEQDLKI